MGHFLSLHALRTPLLPTLTAPSLLSYIWGGPSGKWHIAILPPSFLACSLCLLTSEAQSAIVAVQRKLSGGCPPCLHVCNKRALSEIVAVRPVPLLFQLSSGSFRNGKSYTLGIHATSDCTCGFVCLSGGRRRTPTESANERARGEGHLHHNGHGWRSNSSPISLL